MSSATARSWRMLIPCLNPPTADYLVDLLASGIENNAYENAQVAAFYNRLAEHMRRNKPDKQWMLGLLGTLNPANEIF